LLRPVSGPPKDGPPPQGFALAEELANNGMTTSGGGSMQLGASGGRRKLGRQTSGLSLPRD